ncbi:MAG: segregation/condensation protein A [Candidatus Micrarchaeaceae archaeon]
MATIQAELQVEIHNSADVINLVNTDATWRDLIIELVDKNKLDPWNIDIIEIVDKYVDTVKKLRVLDFRVPANIILAAAILLRLKSNYLIFKDYEDTGEMAAEADVQDYNITTDPLNFRLRLPPKRKISLTELISALDEAMTMKETRLLPQKNEPLPTQIKLANFDIEAETDNIYRIIKGNVDKSKMMTFSCLSNVSSINDVILGIFIPLLYLAHKGKVSLIQEKFFSEIIIALK